jgi:hypothetical protein
MALSRHLGRQVIFNRGLIMRYFKAVALAFGALFLATPIQAQGWSAGTNFADGWFFADAAPQGGAISFGCAGRYPGADPDLGEGMALDPYVIRISMNQTIGVAGVAPGPRNDVIFVIGNTGYQLPGVAWGGMQGDWSTRISVGDPLITALLAGGDAQLWAGQVLIGDLPGAGLAASMAEVIRFCDSHWIASGAPLPSHAAETIQTLRALPAPAASMEQVMLDQITAHCGGPGSVRADAIGRSDFDGDWAEDVLLHWSGVTCQTDNPLLAVRGAGECTGDTCLTAAYVSSSIRAGNAPYEVLAASARVDPAIATDILLGVGISDCAQQNLQPTCQTRFRWTGAEFIRIE